MHQFASGQTAAVGLVSSDGPPLSPETVGRSPSILEAAAPVALKSFQTMLDEKQSEQETVVAPALDVRRVVVRLLGGDELELGSFGDHDGAVGAAKELVKQFSSAEAEGDWPEIHGRFVRPGSVASIDVLVSG